MADRLFEDFPLLTTEAWLAQVQKDLKGTPLARLQWEHESGIPLGAIYGTVADAPGAGFPGLGDYRRGMHPLGTRPDGWELCMDIRLTTPEALTARLTALQDWPDAIRLVFPPTRQWALAGQPEDTLIADTWPWDKTSDLASALELIARQGVKVRVQAGQDFLACNALICAAAPGVPIDLGIGPLDAIGVQPVPPRYLDRLLSDARAELSYALEHTPESRPLTISLEPLALQGAHLAQQTAYALAMAVEYAAAFGPSGLSPAQVFSRLNFLFPIGTDYFGEIARLRAFRMLWAAVLSAYQIEGDLAPYSRILAVGSRRQLASLDAQTNILRATTAAMSAILGGCDSVSLPAFDEGSAAASNLSLRLAANVQRILRSESLLDKVIDPVGGSYYLEHLTDALATRAWELFQGIEAHGGYHQALQNGHIAAQVAESAAKRASAIQKGKTTVLGINQYPPAKEDLDGLQLHHVQAGAVGATSEAADNALRSPEGQRFAALVQHARQHGEVGTLRSGLLKLLDGRAHDLPAGTRDASAFEHLRLRMAAHLTSGGAPVHALLLTLGDLAMRKARATFAANLLGTAAIPSSETSLPDDLDAALAQVKESAPAFVVICGADADYAAQLPDWLAELHAQAPDLPVYLAGRPEGWETWKAAGLRDAIFAGMDRWAFLSGLLDEHIGKEQQHAS